jgi:small subunit ribosomal protein S4
VARYTGPVCRICRREGTKLYLKGERCYSEKCAVDRKNYPPGMHAAEGKKNKLSEFGQQLREKQKVRRAYGLMERQFRLTFQKAAAKRGVISENFFCALELRLDNVVYRMGLARSRNEARQVVRHNHVLVNDKRVNIPSMQVKVGDTVALAEKSKGKAIFELCKDFYNKKSQIGWFEVDHSKHTGKVTALPTREDIQMPVKDRLIVELYSK